MKKIILLILAALLISNFSNSQVKVAIKLLNPGIDTTGLFKWDVQAIVQSGQTWRVGSSNIRVDFYTIPAGKLTVHPDASVSGAYPCLNSGGYSAMTTTSINGGTAISLNISRLAATCTLTTGTYLLGRIRFNRTDTTFGWCTHDTIRAHTIQGQSSVMQDSITVMPYPAQWTRINPPDSCTLVGVESNGSNIPTAYKLYNNYPNPFNPVTSIKYDLPKASLVKIVLYDILGREVATLVNEKKEAGSYVIQWDASGYASGAYFYKIEAGVFIETKKMVLIK